MKGLLRSGLNRPEPARVCDRLDGLPDAPEPLFDVPNMQWRGSKGKKDRISAGRFPRRGPLSKSNAHCYSYHNLQRRSLGEEPRTSEGIRRGNTEANQYWLPG